MKNPRETALHLIELALDDSTTEEESRSAAMKAVKFIDKHELLASPLDELLGSRNETVRAASTVIDKVTDPAFVDSVKKIIGGLSGGAPDDGDGRRRRRRRRR